MIIFTSNDNNENERKSTENSIESNEAHQHKSTVVKHIRGATFSKTLTNSMTEDDDEEEDTEDAIGNDNDNDHERTRTHTLETGTHTHQTYATIDKTSVDVVTRTTMISDSQDANTNVLTPYNFNNFESGRNRDITNTNEINKCKYMHMKRMQTIQMKMKMINALKPNNKKIK